MPIALRMTIAALVAAWPLCLVAAPNKPAPSRKTNADLPTAELIAALDEVRSLLKNASTSQRAFMQERDRYSTFVDELRFRERPRWFGVYFASKGTAFRPGTKGGRADAKDVSVLPVDAARAPATFAATRCPVTPVSAHDPRDRPDLSAVGVTQKPPFVFIIAAAANLDGDGQYECWSIASADRLDPDDQHIPAYTPYREQGDVDISARLDPLVRESSRRLAEALARRSSPPASVAELGDATLPDKDPWGREWILAVAQDRVIVVSKGLDGEFPSKDDVVATERRKK